MSLTVTDNPRQEVDVVRSSAPVAFSGGLVMSPAEAKAQVDAVRELQRAVMTEGVHYGQLTGYDDLQRKPRSSSDRLILYKAGAELLLKVHGYGHRLEPVGLDRGDDGRHYGVTYRCTVIIGSGPDETVVATCDGYCGYDESKYYQPAGPRRRTEYRAPWNTIIKMSQKRALVGAALQATAASGLFTQDVDDYLVSADPEDETPVHVQLGYHDADEMRAVSESLHAMMLAVPPERRDETAALFDRLGYPAGRRLPVAAGDLAEIRAALRAAANPAEPSTAPGAAETPRVDDESSEPSSGPETGVEAPENGDGEAQHPGVALHRLLGACGVPSEAHQAVIATASAGRTSRASELTANETQVAEGLARAVGDGRLSVADILQAAPPVK